MSDNLVRRVSDRKSDRIGAQVSSYPQRYISVQIGGYLKPSLATRAAAIGQGL